MHTTSFVTLEEVKNFKSMQSYKYFTSGWVIEHKWKTYNDVSLITGKVNHSYSVSSTPLQPWVIAKHNGAVVCGYCTCMAGLGETCSHIGALLYWVEYQVRKRSEISSTSLTNSWLEPSSVSSVPYLQIADIDFTSPDKKMKILQEPIAATTTTTSSQATSQPTMSPSSSSSTSFQPCTLNINEFFNKCLDSDTTPVIFSLEEPYNKTFAKAADHFPYVLQQLFNPDYLQYDYVKLLNIAEQNMTSITSTTIQQSHLEEITRSQVKSKLWMKYRSGRITASRLYQVVHTNPHAPSLSLLSAVCYPASVKFTTKATKYGCEHEKDAVKVYKERMQGIHNELNITPAGFVVSTKNLCLVHHQTHFWTVHVVVREYSK